MADEEIRVNISVKGEGSLKKATRSADALADELARVEKAGVQGGQVLGGALKSQASSVGAMGRQMGDLAGKVMVAQMAMQAFAAVSGLVTRAAGSMLQFAKASEETELGIATMLNAMDSSTGWEGAMGNAAQTMGQINAMAAETPATGLELAKIYQGVLGPLRGMGLAQREVLEAVKLTSIAGAAMGIDMDQAQRDVSLMATGMAGADTKMFQLMKTSGILAKSAKEIGVSLGNDLTKGFNKLDPEKRGKLIQAMLGQFGAAGKAAGQTFSGLYSTIKGNLDNILKSGASPLFEAIKSGMSTVSTFIVNNITMLTNRAILIGEAFMTALRPVTDLIAEIFGGAGGAMDAISGQGFADQIQNAAKSFASILQGVIDRLRPIVTMLTGALGATGLMAAGGAAAGGVAAGGAAATAMPLMGMLEPLFSALSSLGAGPIAAVVAGVASMAAAIASNLGPVLAGARSVVNLLAPPLMAVMESLWAIIEPIGLLVGSLGLAALMVQLGGIVAGFYLMLQVLRPLLWIVGRVASALKSVLLPPIQLVIFLMSRLGKVAEIVANWLRPVGDGVARLGQLLEPLIGWVQQLGSALGVLIGKIKQAVDSALGIEEDYSSPAPKAREVFVAGVVGATAQADKKKPTSSLTKSAAKVSINNPRVTIKQDFKGKTDPDRIVRLMMSDLERQAESRMSSAFGGALNR